MTDMRVSTGYLRRLQQEANNELDRRYFAAVAAEIERLRAKAERADELQALIDAYAVAWNGRGLIAAAAVIEARDALLAAATKEDDRG